MQIPARTYGACPFLLMMTPLPGAGQTHRVGPVRHEFGSLAAVSDGRQRKTCSKPQ
jgi:hypothetical protein